MAALPYMQLYIADYAADTAHILDAETHGAYLLLMMNYWQTGKPIPKNRAQAIARMYGNERWTSVEQSLNELFNDTGTHWQHSRIDADLQMVEDAQTQRSKAGKASAEARKRAKQKEAKARSTPNTINNSTTVERPLNGCGNDRSTNKDIETDIDTDTDKEKTLFDSDKSNDADFILDSDKKKLSGELLESFNRFWSAFGKHGNKAPAAKAWRLGWEQIKPELERVIATAEIEAQGRPSLKAIGTTPKMAQGWINERRWENEYIVAEHKAIIEIYNATLPNHPQADFETWRQSEHYQSLQTLWEQGGKVHDREFWQAYFTAIGQDPYCTGENQTGKPVSLGYLVKPNNFTRLNEML